MKYIRHRDDGYARLIAAAPDMLEALRKVTDALEAEFTNGDAFPYRAFVAHARAAIAKATQ